MHHIFKGIIDPIQQIKLKMFTLKVLKSIRETYKFTYWTGLQASIPGKLCQEFGMVSQA